MGKIGKVAVYGAVIGLILSLSQPFYGWWFLVFLGFILIFLEVKIATKSAWVFWLGYTTGLVYFLVDFKWYWAVYPLKNLGFENKPLAFFFVFLTWIITAGTMAGLWGLAVWLFHKIDHRISSSALLIFPSIFTLGEYARSFLIALVWTGHQTPIGPFWTIGNIAYNFQHSFLVLKFASWFGLYGVGWLIIFLSLGLFIFLENRHYKKFLFLLLVIVILFYWPETDPKNNNPDQAVAVAVIQTQVPSKPVYTSAEEAYFFKTQLELLGSVSHGFPQTKLIVFPEESNFFYRLSIFKNAQETSRYFAKLFAEPVSILDNSKLAITGHLKARTIYLNTETGIVDFYDKYLITPGAEYVPLLFRGLDKILGLNSPELQAIQEYQAGDHWPTAMSKNDLKIASLICADIFSPLLAQAGVVTGSNLLVSQSSFAFGNSPKDLLSKDLAASRFRAAESSRYLIKSSNLGYSYLISDSGKLLKTTQNLNPQILTGSVVLKNNKTLYNKVGDSPILLGSFVVLLTSLFFKKRTI